MITAYFVNTVFRGSFVGGVEYFLDMTLGRAAPGVAPSLRKRGPRRPPRTGRRGRLPIKLADPRWGSTYLQSPSKYVTNTDLTLSFRKKERERSVLALAVVARGGGPPIAMVRLAMAMAIVWAAGDFLEAAARTEWVEDERRAASGTLPTLRKAALTSTAPRRGGRA